MLRYSNRLAIQAKENPALGGVIWGYDMNIAAMSNEEYAEYRSKALRRLVFMADISLAFSLFSLGLACHAAGYFF